MSPGAGRIRRAFAACLLIALVGALAGGGVPSLARAATIECAPPASPAATSSPATPAAVPEAVFPEGGGELTVFAAASLTDAFTEIASTLEAAHPGLTITFNFAGSQALVTQLSEGAHADVFASASAAQMTAAVKAGVIASDPVVFTQNRLAVVVPKENPAGIESLAELANDGVKLVLAQPEVPVGQYARQAVCNASFDASTYGEAFAAAVGENIVSEEDNVKAVLAKVQLGEADAGIVYTTDVTSDAADDVMLIEIPAAVNVIATYPVAPVAGGNTELANAFIAYLLGPDGQAVLAKHGFGAGPLSAS